MILKFITILLISFLFCISQTHSGEIHLQGQELQHNDQHRGCVSNKTPTFIQQDLQQHLRLMAASDPHPLIMYGDFPTTTSTGINIDILKKIYAIAAQYFKRVLKVTAITAANTLYPPSSGDCGRTVPSTYINNGFDQNVMDMVIIITIENDGSQSYVAQAGPCVHLRWPTYGLINFNAAYISTDLTKFGTFHSNVYVTMHQMTHILGLNNVFYQQYFTSYSSNTYLSNSSVLGTNSSAPGRVMIITSNVKAYIQAHFGCSNVNIGGLLQEEGGAGSAGSHWERIIYYDEMMTASVWSSGLKITPLTLNLLKDTGFYYSVDTTLAQASYFGKNKGCNFAMGLLPSATPEYCTGSGNGCGFYNQFSGQCSTETFSSGISYISSFSNLICTMPESSNGAFTDYTYDSLSRCFNVAGSNHGRCYIASCTANGVQIQIATNTVTCAPGASTVNTAVGVLTCPSDQTQFCSRSNCQNWCYTQGICINGQCILALCQIAIPNCLSCIVNVVNRCTSCSGSLFPTTTKLSCDSCTNIITNCATCVNNGGVTQCSSCSNSLFPSTNKLSCQACGTVIASCTACTNSAGITKCTACSNNLVPSQDQLSCQIIVCTITNCQSCFYVGNTQNCKVCSSGLFPATNKLSCASCSSIISSCTTCNNNAGTTQCTICSGGLFPSLDKLSCAACGTVITSCTTCNNNAGTTQCTVCGGGLFPSADQSACATCSVAITNCNTCVNNAGITQCNACSNSLFPTVNKLSCQTCSLVISNCLTCTLVSTITTCSACGNNLFPSANNLACQSCSTVISQCLTCTNNASVTQCSVCNIGYYVSSVTVCSLCNSNCYTCVTTPTYCTSCFEGYYLANNNTCLEIPLSIAAFGGTCNFNSSNLLCQRGCLVCSCSSLTATACIKESQGYVIQGTQVAQCPSGCLSCNSINITICTACSNRYSLQGTTCIPCDSSCSSCNPSNASICLTCPETYQVNPTTQLCVKCSVLNCKQCQSNGTCLSCIAGYSVISNGTACDQCLSTCSICSQSNITLCLECADNFYLQNNVCVACPAGCSKCTNTTCKNCVNGYTINVTVGTCKMDCQFPCLTCQNDLPNSCTSCPAGYNLNSTNKICQSVLSCSTTCTNCPLGFVVSGATCANCLVSNCATCKTHVSVCDSCMIGYYLFNGTCSKCGSNCIACIDGDRCAKCSSGFTKVKQNAVKNPLINGKCFACVSPCATCANSVNRCLSCITDYKLIGWKCSPSLAVTFDTTLNINFTTFINSGMHRQLRTYLITQLGSSFANNEQLITFKSLKQGSTVVSGEVGNVPNGSTTICNQSSTIANALSNTSLFNGSQIISSSFSVSDATAQSQCQTTMNYLILILALAIGIPVLIILVIIIVVVCNKCSQREQQVKNYGGNNIKEDGTRMPVPINSFDSYYH